MTAATVRKAAVARRRAEEESFMVLLVGECVGAVDFVDVVNVGFRFRSESERRREKEKQQVSRIEVGWCLHHTAKDMYTVTLHSLPCPLSFRYF
jgi:hypothetical protein